MKSFEDRLDKILEAIETSINPTIKPEVRPEVGMDGDEEEIESDDPEEIQKRMKEKALEDARRAQEAAELADEYQTTRKFDKDKLRELKGRKEAQEIEREAERLEGESGDMLKRIIAREAIDYSQKYRDGCKIISEEKLDQSIDLILGDSI